MKRRWCVHFIGLCIWSAGCSLGSFGSGDDPRPSLGKSDFVQLDECVTIPVSSDLVVQQKTITVTAKRPSGHGAEAVPVMFSIAPCPSESLPIDAGSSDASLDDDAGTEDEIARQAEPICGGPFRELSTDRDHLAGFGLVILDTNRCKGKSTSKVECVLDRSGSIAIAVQNTRAADSIGLRPPAPLCVAIRDFAEGEYSPGSAVGWRYYQAAIATSNVAAFNTLRVIEDIEDPSRTAAEACLSGSCDQKRVVASHIIGIAGSDVLSTGVASTAQFLQLQTSVTAKLQIASQGLSSASLSLTDSCDGDARSELQFMLQGGERYRRFYVCADHFGGFHVGTAVLEGHDDLAASWTNDVDPAVRSLQENNDGTIALVDCDGTRPLLGSEVRSITGPGTDVFFAMDRALDLDEITCLSESDEDGGATTAMPCTGPLEVSLTTGTRCSISRRAE